MRVKGNQPPPTSCKHTRAADAPPYCTNTGGREHFDMGTQKMYSTPTIYIHAILREITQHAYQLHTSVTSVTYCSIRIFLHRKDQKPTPSEK